MTNDKSKKSSILDRLGTIVSLVVSVVSISIALTVYLENRQRGSINIFVPSRYGILRGTHQHNKSDKILMCFTVHNNGNSFRNIGSVRLVLQEKDGNNWNLKAIGKFDSLKNLQFTEYSLTRNPNYSLVTSIPLDKNQFLSFNLLFYYEDDEGWTYSGKTFKLGAETYTGQLVVDSNETHGGGEYKSINYKSGLFEFRVRYEPSENLIDTDTNIYQTR